VRGRGLFAGVELNRDMVAAGVVARRLLQVGMLTEDTHRTTIRFAPPLIISESRVDGAVDRLKCWRKSLQRLFWRSTKSHRLELNGVATTA
jgi:acetylornithine/succinyldiaminopimelate/putrescine aminotransferase